MVLAVAALALAISGVFAYLADDRGSAAVGVVGMLLSTVVALSSGPDGANLLLRPSRLSGSQTRGALIEEARRTCAELTRQLPSGDALADIDLREMLRVATRAVRQSSTGRL